MNRLRPFFSLLLPIILGLALAAVWILWQQLQVSQVLVREVSTPLPSGNPALPGFVNAVQQASPSVVTIYTSRRVLQNSHPLLNDPSFAELFPDQIRQTPETSLGSGVMMSPSGYILTNHHVIENAEQILILLADGRSFEAQTLGTDSESDLALLKIEADSLQGFLINQQPLRVGDLVLAIGNPLNVGQTVTMGIISATGRNHVGLNTYENFIQTDAAINPGNSGGALVNTRGELIGINTAIFSQSGGSQGIGFAIPISLALDTMSQMIAHGRVIRGWLGVEISGVAQVEGRIGVLVAGVLEGAPAEKADIQAGDLILSIDSQAVMDVRQLLDLIASFKPDTGISLKVWRNGEVLELQAKLQERPQQ